MKTVKTIQLYIVNVNNFIKFIIMPAQPTHQTTDPRIFVPVSSMTIELPFIDDIHFGVTGEIRTLNKSGLSGLRLPIASP